MQETKSEKEHALLAFRIIFYFCSVYFLFMGFGMVFFPYFLVKGVAGTDVSPAVIGMLRGAGGAVIPYSALYILIARAPRTRRWGLWVIALANAVAIILDIGSVLLDEYTLGYALIDLPVEFLSLIGIFTVGIEFRNKTA